MIKPLHVVGKCVSSDDVLFEHIRLALERSLPVVDKVLPAIQTPVAIVGSGPSLAQTWEELKAFQGPIVAIRDAHDFLIGKGVVPEYALSVDPLESAAACFATPHPDVHYMIASQSHPAMFDTLKRAQVTLFHLLVTQGQFYPPNAMLIGGATTSGLRAIMLYWALGYREFHLFGMDSCLDEGRLRVNGDLPKESDTVAEVRLSMEPGAEVFRCTPAMALQAQAFQDVFDQAPDCRFIAHGHGLLAAILEGRKRQLAEIEAVEAVPDDGSVSFIHGGSASVASYRYRAEMPARWLGASLNDQTASTLVFVKPHPQELLWMAKARRAGKRVIVDFCDDHFDYQHCQEALKLAHVVTCPTKVMADRIETLTGYRPWVIPESWEFDERDPHCVGNRVLWFGHAMNREGLEAVRDSLDGFDLRVVGNFEGAIPWSLETMAEELALADAVILPATADYKSANRAVEAIRQGCFVVAEPHPALEEFPGIWIGKIREGLEWMAENRRSAMSRTSLNQSFVRVRFAPRMLTEQWKTVTRLPTTSDAATSIGMDGSTSILTAQAT